MTVRGLTGSSLFILTGLLLVALVSGCGGRRSPEPFAGVENPLGQDLKVNGEFVFTANYEGNWEIYTQGASDPRPFRLTRFPQEEEGAIPSPDGTRLAFVSRRDGDYEIYVMNRDGSDQTRLTRSRGVDEDPKWTPDGRKILFESSREGNWDVFIMNADGTGQVNLTRTPFDEADPTLSPDGKKILFKSMRDGDWRLYLMNTDGSELRPLARSAYTEGVLDDPAWSPDGKRIAFVSKRVLKPDVYIMELSPAEQPHSEKKVKVRNLTRNSARDEGPTWSPDGRFLAFVSDREGFPELFVADAATGVSRRIGPVPVVSGPGRWSPDGQWLVYIAGGGGEQKIQLVSADGRNVRDIGRVRGEMTELQWFPSDALSKFSERELVQ